MRIAPAAIIATVAGLLSLPPADSFFTLTQLKPGLFIALATPSHMENSNATVIFLDDALLVIDAEQRPTAAAALIREIRKLTRFPVKYLVNTHFHDDHVQGNSLYRDAWPDVQIISSVETRESLRDRGALQLKNLLATLPSVIDSLRRRAAAPSDAGGRSALQDSLRRAEDYLAELRRVTLVLPTTTFERRMVIHSTHRSVELINVGHAHTDGDVVAFLPEDSVLVTGDVVDALDPWMGDSHPFSWIKVLDAIEKLDASHIVGGHGAVMHDQHAIRLWRDYFKDLVAQTGRAFAAGASLEQARRLVAPRLVGAYGNRFPKSFSDDVLGHVEKAYRVISGVTE